MDWGALARLRETMPVEPTGPPTYPRWGNVVEHRDPAMACDGLACEGRGRGLGVKCNTHLIPPRAGGNAGTRLEACDSPACDDMKRGLECYSPYLVP